MGKNKGKKKKLTYLDESDFDAPSTYDNGDDNDEYSDYVSSMKADAGRSDGNYGDDREDEYNEYDDYEDDDEYDDDSEEEIDDEIDDRRGADKERYDPEDDPYRNWGKPSPTPTSGERSGKPIDLSGLNASARTSVSPENSANSAFRNASAQPVAASSPEKKNVGGDAMVDSNVFHESGSNAFGLKPKTATLSASNERNDSAKAPNAASRPSFSLKSAVPTPNSNAPTTKILNENAEKTRQEEKESKNFGGKQVDEKGKGDVTNEKKSGVQADEPENDAEDNENDEEQNERPSIAARFRPALKKVGGCLAFPFVFCGRLLKKREKTEEERFEEELAREEAEQAAKKAAEERELEKLAEELGEEPPTSVDENDAAPKKRSLFVFLFPSFWGRGLVCVWRFASFLPKKTVALFAIPFRALRKNKNVVETADEAFDDSDATNEVRNAVERKTKQKSQTSVDSAQNLREESENSENLEEDGSPYGDHDFAGRNWMRVVTKTVVVAIVATLIMTTGYVGLLFFSGKDAAKDASGGEKEASALAANESENPQANGAKNVASDATQIGALASDAFESDSALAQNDALFGNGANAATSSALKPATSEPSEYETPTVNDASLDDEEESALVAETLENDSDVPPFGTESEPIESETSSVVDSSNPLDAALETDSSTDPFNQFAALDPTDESGAGLDDSTVSSQNSDDAAIFASAPESAPLAQNDSSLLEVDENDPLLEADENDPPLDGESQDALLSEPNLAAAEPLPSDVGGADSASLVASEDSVLENASPSAAELDVPEFDESVPVATALGDPSTAPELEPETPSDSEFAFGSTTARTASIAPETPSLSANSTGGATFGNLSSSDAGATTVASSFETANSLVASSANSLSEANGAGGFDLSLPSASATSNESLSTIGADWDDADGTQDDSGVALNLNLNASLSGSTPEALDPAAVATARWESGEAANAESRPTSAGTLPDLSLESTSAATDLSAASLSANSSNVELSGASAFGDRLGSVAQDLQANLQHLSADVDETLTSGVERVQSVATQTTDGINAAASSLTTSLNDATTGAREGLDSLNNSLSSAYQTTTDSVRSVGDAARENWQGIRDAANNAFALPENAVATLPALGTESVASPAATPALGTESVASSAATPALGTESVASSAATPALGTESVASLNSTPALSSGSPVASSNSTPALSSGSPVASSNSTPALSSGFPVASSNSTPALSSGSPVASSDSTLALSSGSPVASSNSTPALSSGSPVASPDSTLALSSGSPVASPDSTLALSSGSPVASSNSTPALSSGSPVASPDSTLALSSGSPVASPDSTLALSSGSPVASSNSGGSVADDETDSSVSLPLEIPKSSSYVLTPVGRNGNSRVRLDSTLLATETTVETNSSAVSSAIGTNSSAVSPAIGTNSSAVSSAIGTNSSATSPAIGTNSNSSVARTEYRVYYTKEGDNLLTIAENELGALGRWIEIKRLNGLPSGATYFEEGTKIFLPTR